jgi:hypothetical protein
MCHGRTDRRPLERHLKLILGNRCVYPMRCCARLETTICRSWYGATSGFEDFADLKIKICFSEGMPNIRVRQDIKITDTAPIVRTVESEPNAGGLVQQLAGTGRQSRLQFPLGRA